jgi:cobalt-zinc-cadmium efflux system membrane fusion protein
MQKCICLLLVSIGLTACESEAEREREQRRQVQAKSSVVPDGSIHLTSEQIRINNIQTAVAVERQIATTIAAPGRIKAPSGAESQVFAPFSGRIIAAAAQVPRLGEEVREGQLLAEVEQIFAASERVQFKAASLQLQTDIDHARQELELRQKELDRARQLYDGGAIALKELQAAEFAVDQARTKLAGAERAKAEYDQTVTQQSEQRRTPIRAPIAGTVTATDLVAGRQVDPSKSVMTIVNTATVWAELAVPESALAAARQAMSAGIVVPSNPNRIYNGRIANVGVTVDPQNRTVPFMFAISNSDRSLKLEMFVEGRISVGPVQQTVVVPVSAVLLEQGISSVFVEMEAGTYRRRVVATGPRYGPNISILSGLAPNEKVVSAGAQSLNSETLKNLIPSDEEGGKR